MIALKVGATIAGLLLDAEGKPMAKARIRADGKFAGDTDEEGRFTVVGLEPGKEVHLTSHCRNGDHADLGDFKAPANDVVIRLKPPPSPHDGGKPKDGTTDAGGE